MKTPGNPFINFKPFKKKEFQSIYYWKHTYYLLGYLLLTRGNVPITQKIQLKKRGLTLKMD